MEKFVILVAGGKGERMANALPKQFINIGGKEIIFHTIDAFLETINLSNIVVVLPESQIDYWNKITNETVYSSLKITVGGLTRFESVKSGLKLIPNGVLVGVHDAVRPLVSNRTIEQAFQIAEEKGNAIPLVDCDQSLRKLTESNSIALDRSLYKIVQTPQCFHSSIIKEAYSKPFKSTFTDDASVLESFGEEIYLSEGNIDNIKITYPYHLDLFESILNSRRSR